MKVIAALELVPEGQAKQTSRVAINQRLYRQSVERISAKEVHDLQLLKGAS